MNVIRLLQTEDPQQEVKDPDNNGAARTNRRRLLEPNPVSIEMLFTVGGQLQNRKAVFEAKRRVISSCKLHGMELIITQCYAIEVDGGENNPSYGEQQMLRTADARAELKHLISSHLPPKN